MPQNRGYTVYKTDGDQLVEAGRGRGGSLAQQGAQGRQDAKEAQSARAYGSAQIAKKYPQGGVHWSGGDHYLNGKKMDY